MTQTKKRWDLGPVAHPLFWVALCGLVINDHCLKGHAPGWLTGKLSDLTFLVVAPCVLVVALPTAWAWARRAAFFFPFCVIAGVNVWPALSDAFVAGAGLVGLHWRLWPDVTDLFTLAVMPLTALILGRPSGSRAARTKPPLQACGVIIGTWACVATSAPPVYDANTLLANRSGRSITVRLSPLAFRSSCSDISAQAATLTLGDVAAPRTYTLAPGELLELMADENGRAPEGPYMCNGSQRYDGGCDLIYVEVEGLPGALVSGQTWDYDSFDDSCDKRLKPADKPRHGYLDVVNNGGTLAWRPGESLVVASLDRQALEARPQAPNSCNRLASDYTNAITASTTTCDIDADCVGVIGFATPESPNCRVYFNKGTLAAADAARLTNAWATRGCLGGTACIPSTPALCIAGECRAGCTGSNPPLPLCPGRVPTTPDCPLTCYSPPSHPLRQQPAPLPDAGPPDATPPPDACPYTGVASSLCPR